MQSTSAKYKLEIKKPSRAFECRVTIGSNVFVNEDIVDIILETTHSQDGYTIGSTTSQTLDLMLINKGVTIYSTNQVKLEIGIKIGAITEYILMGYYNVDEVVKTDYTTKFTCYDNMIKFEKTYFSSLGSTATLSQVVNELATMTGVQFTGSLPSYNVKKLEGFTCREILSYIASICGGNALITREGKFTVAYLNDSGLSINTSNYIDYKREEINYKIGKVSCQVGETILSKGSLGTDSMELQFENPWVTNTIMSDIYNKLKTVEYLGYSMKWQGDLSLDPGDLITITDTKGVVRKVPVLSQKFIYTGGLTSEIGGKGESKNKNSFSSSGSGSNKVNRIATDLLIVNEALINKANIKDLEAVSIKTQTLEAKTATIENAIIDVAHITDLNVLKGNITNLIAEDAKINTALINKADIVDLNVIKGHINSLTANVADIDTLLAGNLTGENIQAGGITSNKLTIANGFIKNAMIDNLDVSKINAGTISTSKFVIKSDDGGIEIVGATQQFKDKNNKVRIQMGKDTKGDFNFIIRGADGTSILIDHTGVKKDAIANDLIVSDMIATDSIGEKQLNYTSFTEGFNKDTNTTTIKGTKIKLDNQNQTLDIAFNQLKTQADGTTTQTESNSTTIGIQQGQITTAINNTQIVKDGKTILLKDDYSRTVTTVNSMNSTIGTHTSQINAATGKIDSVETKVNTVERDLSGTKSTVSSHTTQITGLNTTVGTQGSSIEQLKTKIELKVEATDITTAIDKVEIGSRNIFRNSDFMEGKKFWSSSHYGVFDIIDNPTNSILPEGGKKVARTTMSATQTYAFLNQQISCELNTEYTVTFWCYIPSDIPVGSAVISVWYSSSGWNTIKSILITERGIWVKKSLTSTSNSVVNNLIFGIGLSGVGLSGKFSYCCLSKIEKGNKSTDWTPAPEDVDALTTTKITQAKAEIKLETDSIKQSVSSVDSKIVAVDNRLKTAEQKITPDAITNTVKASQTNGKSTFAQTSTVEQLVNQVKFDFRYTTGYNHFKRNGSANILTGGGSCTMNVLTGHNSPGGESKCYQWIYNGTSGSIRFPKAISKNGTYSVSFYVKSINTLTLRIGMDLCDKVGKQTPLSTDTIPANTWQLVKMENIVINNYSDVYNFLDITQTWSTSFSWNILISNIMINEGEKCLPWCANGNELVSGNTIINTEGVTITNGGLTVKNNSGTTMIQCDSAGNLLLKGRLQPYDNTIRLFGEDCRIDATSGILRIQKNPKTYISIDNTEFDFYTTGNNKMSMSFEPGSNTALRMWGNRSGGMLKFRRDIYALESRNVSDNGYGSFIGSTFTNASKREFKENINDTENINFNRILMENNIVTYNYISEGYSILKSSEGNEYEGKSEKLGLIVEDLTVEAAKYLHPLNTDGIDIYAMCSLVWKVCQNQEKEILNLKQKLEQL